MDDLENLTAGKKRRLEDPEFEKENVSKRKIRNEHVQEHALQSEIEEEINFSKASAPTIRQLGAQKGTSQGSVQILVKADVEENVGREIHGNESTVEQPIISERRRKGILIATEDDSKELEERVSEKKHLECSEQKIDMAVLGDDTKESVEATTGAQHDETIPDKGSSESSVKEGDDKDESIKKISERKSPPTVQTFQQLSGIQNAFTGLSGTGFSSSNFTFDTKITSGFGCTPKFGSFNIASSGASPSLLSRESLFGQKQEASQEAFATSAYSVCPSFIFGALDANRALSSTRNEVVFSEVAIQTGEEKEKTMFNADAVLFKYISGSWKERGKGELKINAATEDSGSVTARLVMRTKGNYRLILNANIYPEMKLTNMDKRGLSFTCLNSADDSEEGFKTFALKFKDSSIAEQFQVSLESHKSKQYADSRT